MKLHHLLFFALMLFSCKKEMAPQIDIIEPSGNPVYRFGDRIKVSIDAEDPDGTISELLLILDGNDLGILEVPYLYYIESAELESGSHTLKAIATDNEGLRAETEANFFLDAIPATVRTTPVESVTQFSANTGCEITDQGGSVITAKGVYLDTVAHPEISGQKHLIQLDSENAKLTLTGLKQATTYYVRAYAVNEAGESLGDEISFKTNGPPVIRFYEVVSISCDTVIISSILVDDGGLEIIERGTCWSRLPEPTINDLYITGGTKGSVKTDTIPILFPNTEYYLRPFARNEAGLSYGDQLNLKIPHKYGTLVDIDLNEYVTVQIGHQIWMAENLRVTRYADGSGIPLINNDNDFSFLDPGVKAYSWYGDDIGNGATYGALYTWAGAVNGGTGSNNNPSGIQGVCPDGWHLPSDAEWIEMEVFLGMSDADANATSFRGTNEGGKLKEAGTSHWVSPNSGGTNESGFRALPGGFRSNNGGFHYLGSKTFLITATEKDKYTAWHRFLSNSEPKILRDTNYKNTGWSVRCVKD